MLGLGINIGSASIKFVLADQDKVLWTRVVAHEGAFTSAIFKTFETAELDLSGCPALVTGTEGRFLFNLNNVIEPLCVEAVLDSGVDPEAGKVSAIVSVGGEDLVVYTIDEQSKISNSFSGNKCASGTGEFFKQQLCRMDMRLDQVNTVPEDGRVLPLSARCSVFMKSDCTHRLNKAEATKEEIVLSLSEVMAAKVLEFLKKARITEGRVLLTGGVTQNKHFVRFIRNKAPGIDFVIPPLADAFEAYGAALLAPQAGKPLPPVEKLLKSNHVSFDRLESLRTVSERVTYLPSRIGRVKPHREYILGVDGGSTTTKACLIDIETDEITASYYGRTYGDPVKALKKCLVEIQKQVEADTGGQPITISLTATTGSSREILGVFLETPAVYNEIIAHTVGTTFYNEDVDTIFEIGGQDAKYVFLKNKVPIDHAMNEACSAGTGSFLEESAQGDLNIRSAEEIGSIALQAERPCKFGEHCSAFINSDIRKAIQQGASRPDITAGIITSIVSNYLNRVVGNRTIGNNIVLQGGVAKNPAVPLAFALHLNKDILVPPDPELLGCFGVGILAKQKLQDNLLANETYELESIIKREIIYKQTFKCQSCDNYCPIRVLSVNKHKTMFGGRCNKYANLRKKKIDVSKVNNYVEQRMNLMFETCAPDPQNFVAKRDITVGIPRCFSVYSLWPFYSWFFHILGLKTLLSEEVLPEGIARVESNYCFPAEIAHGAVQDIVERGTDYIFLPHFRDLPSYQPDVHANFCPITQGLPYYIKKAFPDVPEDKLLVPVVTLKFGREKALESFVELGKKLGIAPSEVRDAFTLALAKQDEYLQQARALGEEALREARASDQPVIALLGRPYNAFTPDANMGIPRKFTSRGFTIVPFDILPFESEEIFQNMYWYYGQQDMKSASLLKKEVNIYITYVTNFSCAPDSFILHYLKWIMGTKPFLILELDSHTADAGVDTRVEAFLDIIEGYRLKIKELTEESYDNGLRFINNGIDDIHLRNILADEKIPIRYNPKVKMLVSNMGDFSTQLIAAMLRSFGFGAEALPLADVPTLQIARNHTSGKECVPSHLVLGSALKYLTSEQYRKDHIYIVFVPSTTGPCRTGQYSVFFENLFRDLRLENVLVFTLSADNSYTEVGLQFSKRAWWAMALADLMKDLQTGLRTCAANPEAAERRFQQLWVELLETAEKNITEIIPSLKHLAREISRLPLNKQLHSCPKVLIVGEIYVRRDDFAVDELLQLLRGKGIIGKASGVTEWVHYLDFVREYELKKKLKLEPWYRRVFSETRKKLIKLTIEKIWKKLVAVRVRRALSVTKLIPSVPENMKHIMKNTEKHFLNHELNSEIAVSSGMAATAMHDGYSGIINISPFACLIGRVVEGVVTPWAREHRYPMLSVEVDGNLLPPNTVNKLNIFILNVLRFRQNPKLSEVIDYHEKHQAASLP